MRLNKAGLPPVPKTDSKGSLLGECVGQTIAHADAPGPRSIPRIQLNAIIPDDDSPRPGESLDAGNAEERMLSSSGVRRVGKGFQSENLPLPQHRSQPSIHNKTTLTKLSKSKFFAAAASDAQRSISMDDFAVVSNCSYVPGNTPTKEEPKEESKGNLVQRAFRAIVGGTHSRRMTKAY